MKPEAYTFTRRGGWPGCVAALHLPLAMFTTAALACRTICGVTNLHHARNDAWPRHASAANTSTDRRRTTASHQDIPRSCGEQRLRCRIRQVEIVRHRLIGHLPRMHIQPVQQMSDPPPAPFRQPFSASAITNGSVALVSAKVEVRATAPGMLVTQ